MEHDDLIKRLQDRIEIHTEPLGPVFTGVGTHWDYRMYPRLTDAKLEAEERRLGFALPALMRRVYLEVGGGQYATSSGLSPLSADSVPGCAFHEDVVGLYLALLSRPELLIEGEWPRSMLPFWEWGGGIFSCLYISDSSDSDPQVFRLEEHYEIVRPAFPSNNRELQKCFLSEGALLSEWFDLWLEGAPLVGRHVLPSVY